MEKTASMKHYAKKKSMGICVYGGCHKKALPGGLKCMQHASKRAKKAAREQKLEAPIPPTTMKVQVIDEYTKLRIRQGMKSAYWRGMAVGVILTTILWLAIIGLFF